ncbi:MAG: SoxR reducing system RseC family protein [Bacteroidales bacterium]|nr:SoxR reducing system RseC family protein [Bacteroidales bacterium]
MTGTFDDIHHSGIISEIKKEKILVSIISHSACSSCKVKGMCNVSEMKEKIVEVNHQPGINYKIGEEVNVLMKKSLGSQAVFLAYVLPFLIMFIVLIILINLTGNEGFSGLISIAILVPYFYIIYLLRDRFKKKFVFIIQKKNLGKG